MNSTNFSNSSFPTSMNNSNLSNSSFSAMPMNYSSSMPTRYDSSLSSSAMPVSYSNQSGDRVGFLGPFILGGITGGLLAPAFTPRPYYNNYYYPYPYYGNYYR